MSNNSAWLLCDDMVVRLLQLGKTLIQLEACPGYWYDGLGRVAL